MEPPRLFTIDTPRLQTALRRAGNASLPPLVLVHGNVSSSRFFENLMGALSPTRQCLAPDLRGYGGSEARSIDATRGMRDFSDDLEALLRTLDISEPVELLGWSAGSGVVMQYAIDQPDRVRSIVLESAMSPYGFGGTRGDGSAVWPDFAGSGGGTANPDFVRLLAEGDRTDESPVSPRNVMNLFYFKPPFRPTPEDEEAYLTAMLEMTIDPSVYPGDLVVSDNWPGVAPGVTGINNAIAPKYLDLSGFSAIEPKAPVLWVRGADDQIVSDTSFFDFAYLGQLGLVPGWPGAEVFPTQPMVGQVRELLERYRADGGSFREVVFEDCGHSPHLEQPERFAREVLEFLG